MSTSIQMLIEPSRLYEHFTCIKKKHLCLGKSIFLLLWVLFALMTEISLTQPLRTFLYSETDSRSTEHTHT